MTRVAMGISNRELKVKWSLGVQTALKPNASQIEN